MFDLLQLLPICFKKRDDYDQVTQYVMQNLDLLSGLLIELEDAVSMFNAFNTSKKIFDKEELLINAQFTRKILAGKNLPTVQQLMDEISSTKFSLKDKFETEFDKFDFISGMTDYQQLLCCVVVAFYRTYMLVRDPELKTKNVQVASTIEEMLTIMYLKKHDTYLFQGIKHWVLDYEEEGFSKELANLINS